MWLIVAACLAAVLIGLGIDVLAGLSLWRSGKRLMRTFGQMSDRASQAGAQMNSLSQGVGTNPREPGGRTMNEMTRPGR